MTTDIRASSVGLMKKYIKCMAYEMANILSD